jgi:hypothetical protein
MIKRRMRFARYVARMAEMVEVFKVSVGKPGGNYH